MPINTLQNINAASVPSGNQPPTATPVKGKPEVEHRQNLPASGESVPPNEQKQSADRADIEQAVTRLNDHVQLVRRDLQFSIDDDTGKTIVKVLDSESGDLIRQIPSEELIAIAQAIADNLEAVEGLILKEEA